MQFSLIYRYDPDGPGPIQSDIDAWMALSGVPDAGRGSVEVRQVVEFDG